MRKWVLKKYTTVGYAVKTWLGSAVLGTTFWIIFMVYVNNQYYISKIFAVLFSWLIGVFWSLLLSTPLLLFYLVVIAILARSTADQIQFKSALTVISVAIWLVATYVLFKMDGLKEVDASVLLFFPYLIGLLICIWTNDLAGLKNVQGNLDSEDILDLEI